MRRISKLVLAVAVILGTIAVAEVRNAQPSSAVTAAETTERVSVDSAGGQGNGRSGNYGGQISADGRYVTFDSSASNLVVGDTNSVWDIFVHDRLTGLTERVSLDSAGAEGNNDSYAPSISGDGRYVAFESLASNLAPGGINSVWDIFLHDRVTGLTETVSVGDTGAQANGDSFHPSISADGRYVTFASSASNLAASDTNGASDIFVHDRVTGATERVSVDSVGAQGNNDSYGPSISGDGRYVAFSSMAINLVAGDTNDSLDIFVHDRATGATELMSVDSAGAQGNDYSYHGSISADGRYVAFLSSASNLVPGDTNGAYDIFVHDRVTGLTERVSVDSAGAQGNSESHIFGAGYYSESISADGRYVAFVSWANNLVSGDTNGTADVFVRNRCPDGGCGSSGSGIDIAIAASAQGIYPPTVIRPGQHIAMRIDSSLYSSASVAPLDVTATTTYSADPDCTITPPTSVTTVTLVNVGSENIGSASQPLDLVCTQAGTKQFHWHLVVSPVGFDDADSTNNSFDGVEQVLYRFVYIAAGDSIPGGMDTGTGDCPHNVPDCNGDASKAYPAALAEQYAASIGTSFAVSNISCSGATSSQFLGGGDKCGSLQGRASQYLYLLAHPADLITITVGADDYVLPAASRCLDEAKNAKEKFKWLEKCSKNALAKEKTPLKQTAANLEKILNWVVVAQPTASIVVTGYYDPLPQSVARLTCNGDPTFGTVFCNFLNSDVVDPLNAFFKNANQGIADLNTALSTVVGRYSAQTAGRVKFAPINQQFIGHCSAMQLQGVGLLGWVDFDLGCSASSTWIAPAAPIEVLSASSTFGTASLTFRPGVHPNQTGHKCIASVVLRLLVPASPSRCS